MDSLEIYRPVTGMEKFVDVVKALGNRILGNQTTGGVRINGEDGSELIPAGYPYFEVTNADNLRFSLYTRRDLPENNLGSKFASVRKIARVGDSIPRKYKNGNSLPESFRMPLSKVLTGVQLAYDIPTEHVEVIFCDVAPRISADVKNGLLSLMLIPDLETNEGRMLVEQALSTHRYVQGLSRRLAFGASDFVPGVEIGTLRKIPLSRNASADEFMREVKKQLPIMASVGKPQVS